MDIKGQAWKFGANVDTDVIIPVRYLISFDPVELGKHCLEGLDPSLRRRCSLGTSLWRRKILAAARHASMHRLPSKAPASPA